VAWINLVANLFFYSTIRHKIQRNGVYTVASVLWRKALAHEHMPQMGATASAGNFGALTIGI